MNTLVIVYGIVRYTLWYCFNQFNLDFIFDSNILINYSKNKKYHKYSKNALFK